MPDRLFVVAWLVLLIVALVWYRYEQRRRLRAYREALADIERTGRGRERL
jgi:cbb3-type cytochrome oxidase subunit 3